MKYVACLQDDLLNAIRVTEGNGGIRLIPIDVLVHPHLFDLFYKHMNKTKEVIKTNSKLEQKAQSTQKWNEYFISLMLFQICITEDILNKVCGTLQIILPITMLGLWNQIP